MDNLDVFLLSLGIVLTNLSVVVLTLKLKKKGFL